MKQDQIVIYKDENNSIQLDVRMEGEMLWLDRQQLATLFGRDYKTISKHINNALKEELADSEEVVAKFATTTQHGAMKDKTQTHDKEYFNLEMVTSVGYRVKSRRGVMFRKWANKVLKQYLVKGYVINERIRKEQIDELRQMVQVIGRTLEHQSVPQNGRGFFYLCIVNIDKITIMTFKELLNSDSFEEVAPKHHNDAEIAACCIWHTSFYGYVDALSSRLPPNAAFEPFCNINAIMFVTSKIKY